MDLLTPREAADLLGVTPHTLARWARSGLIPSLRLPGGNRRYPRSGLMAALVAHDASSKRLDIADNEGRLALIVRDPEP